MKSRSTPTQETPFGTSRADGLIQRVDYWVYPPDEQRRRHKDGIRGHPKQRKSMEPAGTLGSQSALVVSGDVRPGLVFQDLQRIPVDEKQVSHHAGIAGHTYLEHRIMDFDQVLCQLCREYAPLIPGLLENAGVVESLNDKKVRQPEPSVSRLGNVDEHEPMGKVAQGDQIFDADRTTDCQSSRRKTCAEIYVKNIPRLANTSSNGVMSLVRHGSTGSTVS